MTTMTLAGEPIKGIWTEIDGGWGWIVVIGSLMIHIIADGVSYSFGIFVQPLIEYFQVGRTEVGWLGSLLFGVTWGSGPVASILTNRYGCQCITIVGCLLAATGLIITIFMPSIWCMYISFGLLTGFGFGLIYLPAIIIVSYYFERRRSFAMGLAVSGTGLGTLIFAPLSQLLMDEYGWKGALLIASSFVLNCLVCGALFRTVKRKPQFQQTQALQTFVGDKSVFSPRFISPDCSCQLLQHIDEPMKSLSLSCSSQSDKQTADCLINADKPDSGHSGLMIYLSKTFHSISLSASSSSESQPTKHDNANSIMSLFRRSTFILFALSNFLTSIGYCVPYIFLPDRAILLGIRNEEAAYLISAIGVSNTFARVLFGYVADYKWINRIFLYNIVLIICGVASFLSYFCTVFYTLLLYSLVFGIFMGAYTCLIPIVLVDLFGLDTLPQSFGVVGAVLGPPLAGWLFDFTKNYTVSFFATGAVTVLSGIMLCPIPWIGNHSNTAKFTNTA